VGDRDVGGEPGRDPLVELLAPEDPEHLARGRLGDRRPIGQPAQDRHQAPGRGDVVPALRVRPAVLDPPENLDPRGPERLHECGGRGGRDPVDQEVRGQVAALGDHQPDQLADGLPLANPGVEGQLGVVLGVERERGPVGDAGERVDDRDPVIERELAGGRLAVDLHHHRDLHRAGRVERLVGPDQALAARFEVAEGHGHDDALAQRGQQRLQPGREVGPSRGVVARDGRRGARRQPEAGQGEQGLSHH